MTKNVPLSAESGAPDYRLWWEQSQRLRSEVEQILDVVLGTDEDDGAGEGLVADVALAVWTAWNQGYTAGVNDAASATGHVAPNPYATTVIPPGQGKSS